MSVVKRFELFKSIPGFWLVENERSGGYDLVGGYVSNCSRTKEFTVLFAINLYKDTTVDLDIVFTDLVSAQAYLFDNNFKKAENNDSCS